RGGRLEPAAVDLDETAIRRMVERVIAPLGLRLDRSSPMVDARLPDGSRLHAVLPPVAVDGTCVAIRRFGAGRRQLGDFDLTAPGAELLRWAVRAGWNLLLSGGTGAGKTTLLNVLAREAAPGERIVTIEETAELALGRPHVVRLEARAANAEGAGAVPVRALVRAALRLRPDRLVVGEVRGGEAFDLLQALNTGHCGSLCTIHANGPGDALSRLESLVLLAGVGLPAEAIRAQIRSSVDAVVHVARRPGGHRTVEAISELGGDCGLHRLYPLGPGSRLPSRPPRLTDVAPFDPGPPAADAVLFDRGWIE
ncbi:MAG: pilus assembly protein CpaF, partial [Actinomycetota bacterium]|nr:pilus assembly protein CpaF [Actinomycetota bacterium]